MFHLRKKYISEEKGTTAVEFALVSIIFLTIVFAIMEGGRIFWALNTLQYAVETGTRFVLTNTDATDDEIDTAVRDAINGIESDDDNPVITIQTTTINDIDFIIITAEYTFSALLPFLPDGFNSLPLSAQSRLPIPDD